MTIRRLENKSILVAGAGGIGGGLARRFAAEGANVVLGDLSLAGAEAVVHEIVQGGGNAAAVRLDGADEESVDAAIATTAKIFGGLDGLHANFATFIDDGAYDSVPGMPMDLFDEVIRVNLRGYVLCARAGIPHLLERGGGSLIFTSSIAAYMADSPQVAYGIAKEATHNMMRNIAFRYGPRGLRANAIAPGTIEHGGNLDRLDKDFKAFLLDIARIKSRFGAPQDIAALAALLMSDEGSFITGQVMTVDGGATMRP